MKNETQHNRLNEKMWDRWASSIDSNGWRYEYLRDAQRKLISILDIKEGFNFLDVGCGTGWAVGEIAKLVSNNGSFYGVDLSPKMIEKAKDKFSDRTNFQFLIANAESIPLNNNFFDVVICTNSFHHYLNPDKALNEMYRLLKKGGKIYILDPTADKWMIKVADKIIKLFEPEHVKLYSTTEFQRLFENAKVKYINSKKIKASSKVHIGEK
jgi:ubiquinone/menaquinone biosynthesis C-methylase UbiE